MAKTPSTPTNLWARFDNIASTAEVADARAQFIPIAIGTYEMKLEALEAGEDTNGMPMVKGRFRTDTNKVVFYNQNLQNVNYPDMTAGNIAKAVEFVSGLLNKEVEFTTLGAFADTIATVPLDTMHTIKVTFGKKDVDCKFPVLTVIKPVVNMDDMTTPFDEA